MKPTSAPLFPVLLACIALAGCTPGERDAAMSADTLTREQRDSILAESKLPGAGAVGAARETSKAASARASQLDSLSR